MAKDSKKTEDPKPQGSANSKPKDKDKKDEPRLGTPPVPSKDDGKKDSDDGKLTPPFASSSVGAKPAGRVPGKKVEPEEEYDCLKQYEIHRPTGRPYFELSGIAYSPPTKGSKRALMKEVLLKQPRVTFMAPRKDGEHKSVHQQVCLNGYRLEIPKNTYVRLPQQIVEVLSSSLEQTEAALNQFLIGSKQGTEDALK